MQRAPLVSLFHLARSDYPPEPASPDEGLPNRSAFDEYVKLCKKNRGVDCEEEARQMLYGPADVPFPGDPAIFPRPDLNPRPAPPPPPRPMTPPKRSPGR
jgi:hypothetical protein